MKNIYRFLIVAVLLSPLCAKEPSGIMIGAGAGYGRSELSIEHSHIAKNPLVSIDPNNPLAPLWTPQVDSQSGSWAVAWEVLVGYKHFINDFVGFRYYANIGVQHYKPVTYKSNKEPIGYVDYTLNADILFDFYESESVAFGIFGGVGFGGTSLDKQAINEYESLYNNAQNGIPIGASDITKHFLNVNFSAGIRLVFFQKITTSSTSSGAMAMRGYGAQNRSTAQSAYIGHNFEVVAKFSTLSYSATTPDYNISTLGTTTSDFRSRPGYKIKNPYRFTFRYVVEF